MTTAIKGNTTSTFGGAVDLGSNNLTTTGTITANSLSTTGTITGSNTTTSSSTRILGTSNTNHSLVQTEVLSGTLTTSWTNILTLTPNSTSSAWYRNVMEVSCSGHHNSVGNGAVWGVRLYYECNNSTLSSAVVSAGTVSGNYPSFQIAISGGSFILQGQVGSYNYHGVYEVKFHISEGQGSGAPTSWTITRGTL